MKRHTERGIREILILARICVLLYVIHFVYSVVEVVRHFLDDGLTEHLGGHAFIGAFCLALLFTFKQSAFELWVWPFIRRDH